MVVTSMVTVHGLDKNYNTVISLYYCQNKVQMTFWKRIELKTHGPANSIKL